MLAGIEAFAKGNCQPLPQPLPPPTRSLHGRLYPQTPPVLSIGVASSERRCLLGIVEVAEAVPRVQTGCIPAPGQQGNTRENGCGPTSDHALL